MNRTRAKILLDNRGHALVKKTVVFIVNKCQTQSEADKHNKRKLKLGLNCREISYYKG